MIWPIPSVAKLDLPPLFKWKDDNGKYTSRFAKEHASNRHTAVLNPDALGDDGLLGTEVLALNLSPELTVVVTAQRVQRRGRKNYSWFGRIKDDPESDVIFSRNGKWVGGFVRYQAVSYWILPTAENLYEILQLNDGSFPEDDTSDIDAKPGKSGPGNVAGRFDGVLKNLVVPATPVAERRDFYRLVSAVGSGDLSFIRDVVPEDGSNIDVLVAYTPAVKYYEDLFGVLGGFLEGMVQIGIDQANQSFINSSIETRLNRVGDLQLVEYSESDLVTNVDNLRNSDDGFMDELHLIRNEVAADLVILITASATKADGVEKCGRAYEIRNAFNAFPGTRRQFEVKQAASAFAIVKLTCVASSNFSFAHEVGHLLGANHDRIALKADLAPTLEDEARGVTVLAPDASTGRRTIMAYSEFCDKFDLTCPRMMRWSDPDDTTPYGTQLGVPVGQADTADSQHVIAGRTILPVSNYRWWGCRHLACSGLQSPLP